MKFPVYLGSKVCGEIVVASIKKGGLHKYLNQGSGLRVAAHLSPGYCSMYCFYIKNNSQDNLCSYMKTLIQDCNNRRN